MEENKVLAVVAGEEIRESDLNDFLKNVPQEQQMYLANPQVRQQYLEQLIAVRLFVKQALEEKIDETEEYKEMMNSARTDILAHLMISKTMKKATVTDEEAKDYYEANRKQFAKGETVKARHILIDTEDTCREVLDAINSGAKTFEDAAREYSTCPSKQNGGNLGEFGKGQMVPEFENAAFSAELNEVAGPVKTDFGYHLIKVEEKNEAKESSFEEVKDSIKQNMLQQKQSDAYNQAVRELKEKYM